MTVGPPSPLRDNAHRNSANAAGWSTRHARRCGTRRYRIAEEATERQRRSGCNNQVGRNGFFLPAAPADHPRKPLLRGLRRRFPNTCAAGGIVPDNGGTAPGGTLCPFRWLDTSAEPSAATTAVPPPCIRRRNKTSARSKGESDGRSLCTGSAATAAHRGGIETPAEMKQAERGPREVVLPTVKPRFEA
jgi:hypothetical protein